MAKRSRSNTTDALKNLFHTSNYTKPKDEELMNDEARNKYVILGRSNKKYSLEFDVEGINMYVHEEDGETFTETVPYKFIKSITVVKPTVLMIDWHRGPYKTEEKSVFETKPGEAKKMHHEFFLRVSALLSTHELSI